MPVDGINVRDTMTVLLAALSQMLATIRDGIIAVAMMLRWATMVLWRAITHVLQHSLAWMIQAGRLAYDTVTHAALATYYDTSMLCFDAGTVWTNWWQLFTTYSPRALQRLSVSNLAEQLDERDRSSADPADPPPTLKDFRGRYLQFAILFIPVILPVFCVTGLLALGVHVVTWAMQVSAHIVACAWLDKAWAAHVPSLIALRWTQCVPAMLGGPIGIIGGVLGFGCSIVARLLVESFDVACKVAQDLTITMWFAGRPNPNNSALDSDDDSHESPSYGLRQCFGLLGWPLGLLAGIIGGGLALLIRLIENSWLMGKQAIKTADSWFYDNGQSDEGETDVSSNQQPVRWFPRILGLPGWIIGTVLGLMGGVITGNVISICVWAVSIYHLVWCFDTKETKHKWLAWCDTFSSLAHCFSLPGLLFGCVAGVIVAIVGIVKHIVWESLKAAVQTSSKIAQITIDLVGKGCVTRDETTCSGDQATGDTAELYRCYSFGLPGLLVGAALGSVGAVCLIGIYTIRHSLHVGKVILKGINRQVFSPADTVSPDTDDGPQHWFPRYVLGAPGWVIGGMLGSMYIFLRSIIFNFVVGILLVAKLGWTCTLDWSLLRRFAQQPWPVRFIGLPGWLVGSALGSVLAVVGLLKQVLWESIRTAYLLAQDIVKTVHFAAAWSVRIVTSAEQSDAPHSAWRQYGVGVLGLPLGYLLGVIGSVLVLSFDSIVNHWKAGCYAWNSIRAWFIVPRATLIAGQDIESRHDSNNNSGHRTSAAKQRAPLHWFPLLLGLPGLMLGACLSLVSHIIWANVIDVWRSAVTVCQSVWNLQRQTDAWHDAAKHRSRLALASGAPGLMVGALLGVVLSSLAIIKHILVESVRTASLVSLFVWGKTERLVSDGEFSSVTWPAHRRSRLRQGFGLPGWLLGGVSALIGAVVIILCGIVANSWRNSIQVYHKIMPRCVVYSADSSNIADTAPTPAFDLLDHRWWVARLLGAPGWIIGGAWGGLSWCAHKFWHLQTKIAGLAQYLAQQSWQSFLALSGSCWNGAFARACFGGLRQDTRSGRDKFIGGLGYVVACCCCVPLAAMVWGLRHLLLGVSYGLTGLVWIVTLPFFVLGVHLNAAHWRRRHMILRDVLQQQAVEKSHTQAAQVPEPANPSQQQSSDDALPQQQAVEESNEQHAPTITQHQIQQRVVCLLGCLTKQGNFSPQQIISLDTPGRYRTVEAYTHSLTVAWRRSLTMAAFSKTERLLLAIEGHASQIAHGNKIAFDEKVNAVAATYASCYECCGDLARDQAQVKQIAAFIWHCLDPNHSHITVPEGLYLSQYSWRETFYGNNRLTSKSNATTNLLDANRQYQCRAAC